MNHDVLMALSPFSARAMLACYRRDARRGGDSRDVGKHGSPEGHRLASHTKTLKIGGFRDFQLHSSHIGEGLVRVDVSLLLSLRQRK